MICISRPFEGHRVRFQRLRQRCVLTHQGTALQLLDFERSPEQLVKPTTNGKAIALRRTHRMEVDGMATVKTIFLFKQVDVHFHVSESEGTIILTTRGKGLNRLSLKTWYGPVSFCVQPRSPVLSVGATLLAQRYDALLATKLCHATSATPPGTREVQPLGGWESNLPLAKWDHVWLCFTESEYPPTIPYLNRIMHVPPPPLPSSWKASR